MRRSSRATIFLATLVCELSSIVAGSAGCARGRQAPAPAVVHGGEPAVVAGAANGGAQGSQESKDPGASNGSNASNASKLGPKKISRSIVSVVISAQGWDFATPWAKQKPWTRWVSGVVVEGRRILITGGSIGNATLVQVQKDGLPKRYTAEVQLIDYEIPVALLSVADEAFWKDLEPMPIAEVLPNQGEVTIYRWLSSGQLEDAPGKIRQVRSADHWPGRSQVLTLDVTTQMDNAGFSEAVIAGGKVVGISTSKTENQLLAIGAPMLRTFLDNAKSTPYRGTARGGYGWERLTNPALRKSLGLGGEKGGVLITEVYPHGSTAGVLQPGDVLLGVKGYPIDEIGMFDHPVYGRLSSSVLLNDGVRPGDTIDFDVSRGGKKMKLRATLKRMRADDDKIPPYTFDQAPEYLVSGGFLFQHLTRSYLQTWRDWWKRAPLRLLIAHDEEAMKPTAEEPRLVVLTKVLPDPVNLGYQDLPPMIVKKVNGKAVHTLEDVRAALAAPVDGFQVIETLPGQGPRRIVIDAAEANAAEARIREAYGIEERGSGERSSGERGSRERGSGERGSRERGSGERSSAERSSGERGSER